MRRRLLAVSAGLFMLPSVVDGQVIVMRKPMSDAVFKEGAGAYVPPKPGHWVVGDPVVTPGCSSSQPAQSPVACVDDGGTAVDEARCIHPRPSGRSTIPNYATCSYTPIAGDWTEWSSTCADSAQRFRATWCYRSDGSNLDISRCAGEPPARTETASILTGCSYEATYGADGACTATGTGLAGTRTAALIACRRSDGRNVTVENAGATTPFCSPTRTTACTLTTTGTYSDTYGTCSGGVQYAPLTRCTRSDGVDVASSLCAPQSPARNCTMPPVGSCETVAGSRWTGKVLDASQPSVSYSGTIAKLSDLQAACQAMFVEHGKGACFYSPSTRNGVPVYPATFSYRTNYAWITFASRSDLTAANCGQ